MAFDREGAKKAGYSDQEIETYLASKRSGKPRGVVPENLRDPTRRALGLLPVAGGAIGGGLGATGGAAAGMGVGSIPGAVVGGVGGAALGGAGGRAAENALLQALLGDEPMDAFEATMDVGREGLMQGAMEGAGLAGAKGLSMVGRQIMEEAVPITQNMARDFPDIDVIGQIMKDRMTVPRSRGMVVPEPVAGAAPIPKTTSKPPSTEMVFKSDKELGSLLDKAQKSGWTANTDDLVDPVLKLMDDIVEQPIAGADRKAVMKMLDTFVQEHPGQLTPQTVRKMGQRAWEIAEPILKRKKVRPGVNAREAIRGRFANAVGTGVKQALETIEGVPARQQRTQALIASDRALQGASRDPSLARVGGGIGRLKSGIVPSVEMSRPAASELAQSFSNPASRLQRFTRQAPRGLEALVEQMLMDSEDQGGF